MVTVIQRRLGTTGKGPGLQNYIRLPDPTKPRPPVTQGTR